MSAFALTRRAVLASFGLAVGTLAIGPVARAAVTAAVGPGGAGLAPNAFVHVAPDGIVTLVCARSEMGQGVRSSLPALIAAELGADRARVRIVQADGDARFGNQDTDGSSSVRGDRYDELRRLGAVARTMLIEAAARRWHVPPAECEAHEHAVWHTKSRREPRLRRARGAGVAAARAVRRARRPAFARGARARPSDAARRCAGRGARQGGLRGGRAPARDADGGDRRGRRSSEEKWRATRPLAPSPCRA